MQLVWPSREYLASYVDALERGWSPDNVRGLAATREELDAIAINADLLLASLVDREAMAGPVRLLDGSTVPRAGLPAVGTQRRGYATRALKLVLEDRAEGFGTWTS